MKTEAQDTQQLLAKLKAPGRTLKLCDRFTKGVPDVATISGFRSAWWEIKKLHDERENLLDPRVWCDNQVQLHTLLTASGFYYVRDHFRDRTLLAWAYDVHRVFRLDQNELPSEVIKIAPGDGLGELQNLLYRILERGELHEFNLSSL